MHQQNSYQINRVSWAEAEPALRAVREQVFMQEQQVPAALEWDGLDTQCMHLQVTDHHGRTIATARILKNGHIGRMAVLPKWRGLGIGTAMLQNLLAYCTQHKLRPHLDAQTHALDFYRRIGFRSIGDEFLDADIPHRHMEYIIEP